MRLNIVTDNAYSSCCDSYTKLSLAALFQDVLTLYALQEIVLSRKCAHKVYMYIPPLRIRNMEETFFLQYYMLDMIFTILVFVT